LCGEFFSTEDGRIYKADLEVDTDSLIISSMSFVRKTMACPSCAAGHQLLPRKRNLLQWTGGRVLIILADQNFATTLSSADKNAPSSLMWRRASYWN
jgi:hypothetical protein